uniref:F-box domain-containing protein n=1 Tax=Romanomermis culicivorax TaxID=13658 RepID=A0A915IFM2_ROMCU
LDTSYRQKNVWSKNADGDGGDQATNRSQANLYFDLLKKIFAHLTVEDLLRARQVCRMWNDVAMLKQFWELAPLK